MWRIQEEKQTSKIVFVGARQRGKTALVSSLLERYVSTHSAKDWSAEEWEKEYKKLCEEFCQKSE